MKSFRMKKLWKAISLSLCGILTAGIIAGCGGFAGVLSDGGDVSGSF